ncbi:MAG: Tm-1-like ATP-binding domain-containing protein [Alphaproteobacteria bacterium]|jgi:uncharacterized protein (UPF0261 family)
MPQVPVAVLVTLDTKAPEAAFVCERLSGHGCAPFIVDLSLRPHDVPGAEISGGDLAAAAGSSWEAMAAMDRTGASETMIAGARSLFAERVGAGTIAGAISVGGANGTSMGCALMRELPLFMPKVMVSAVAATAAVQWYVGESDITMMPMIGDAALNRVTRRVMANASAAVAAMAGEWVAQRGRPVEASPPLIAVSSFGGTAKCVDRVTELLLDGGYEVIHFHASGPGGRALESLTAKGEIAGVVDVTTHELTDLVVDGVYSAGDGRLRAAAAAGIPQVIVPGAIDHSNFWVGQVPEKFRNREFFQFNANNLLMRTDADEFERLGRLMAERLNAARGPFVVMIPTRGFSEHTKRMTHDIDGKEVAPWHKPEVDRVFVDTLRAHVEADAVEELDMHVSDPEFAEACVAAFVEMMETNEPARSHGS